MPPNTVSVTRPGRWGNPFVVGEVYVRRRMCPGGGEESNIVVDAEHAVRLFRRFTARETLYQIDAYRELRGKDLACWCPLVDRHGEYVPCHADVLLSLVNDIAMERVVNENLRRAKGEAT